MKRIEFTPPANVVPEGTKAGEEFDLVCSFRVKPDGDVCLIQMGDEKLPGYSDKAGNGKPSYKDEHEAMMGGDSGTAMGSGGGAVQTAY